MSSRGACRRLRASLLIGLLGTACGDPVQDHIDAIVAGGQGLEEARLALNMAKADAVEPLIHAFEDRSLPLRARLDLTDALYRLYLREEDARVYDTLVAALHDAEAPVRAGAARALGSLSRRQAVEPLLARFAVEADAGMKGEILAALEFMSMEGGGHVTPHLFSDEQKARFAADLQRSRAAAEPDSLAKATTEWLEVLAEDMAGEAQRLLLAADVAGAEARLLAARELVPDSKNINQKIGKLYHAGGDPARALEYLERHGMVARAHRLPATPVLDGRIDEAAWAGTVPLTGFYQCIWRMSALPTEGRSEVRVGYRNDTLFVAVKGYEPSTQTLVAKTTTRDGLVHEDDCLEIFLDPALDFRHFYQFVLNTLGTVSDFHTELDHWPDWSADYDAGIAVEDTFWAAEVALPMAQLRGGVARAGDIWGFNVARVRIGNASEYGQWVPTYGSSRQPDRFGFLLFE